MSRHLLNWLPITSGSIVVSFTEADLVYGIQNFQKTVDLQLKL
ncbi:unnamed protein product [Acanthoscelides obtectus]|uniref:Uncharacterized protein n=1 Tax=Acanthoscelides obtectus TaxID=200917 RepID=A0A9P0K150_ACAOB|nr:unnamed protein product [Acanthoscelides obtectus]CAK1625310.1 hypothetical protein AOBTE_LOCUS3099 [Acanthoscelides obtectus]